MNYKRISCKYYRDIDDCEKHGHYCRDCTNGGTDITVHIDGKYIRTGYGAMLEFAPELDGRQYVGRTTSSGCAASGGYVNGKPFGIPSKSGATYAGDGQKHETFWEESDRRKQEAEDQEKHWGRG